MRPLWAEFPREESLYGEEGAFMLGAAVLVQPVTAAGQTAVSVTLPPGLWYDAHTLRSAAAGARSVPVTLDGIPVYYRGGSVVVRKDRARRSSTLMRFDPFTVVVALDAQLNAQGRLYLDDGESFDYQQGRYAHVQLTAAAGKDIRCEPVAMAATASSQAPFHSDVLVERIVLLGLPKDPAKVTVRVGTSAARELEGGRAKDGSWVIRRPELRVTDTWTISLA